MSELGSWGGLQVRLTLPEVTDVTSGVSTVLDLLNVSLDLGLSILEIVRTFTPPTLNPIKALLDELITLCHNGLIDLRQLGLYAHLGDFRLLSGGSGFAPLKGGYQGYQRRMVTRLTDRRDLGRPNFSADTQVLALFLYTGVDVSFVNGAVDTTKFQSLRRTGAAFGRLLGMAGIGGRNTALPVPVGLNVAYPFTPTRTSPAGTSPALAFALASSEILGRDTATVSWNVAPAPGAPDTDPTPTMPPGGFLVEVSCVPNGFFVGWIAPTPSSTGGPGGSGSADGHQSYQTGTYQEGDTGLPLRIFGGIDTIQLDPAIQWDQAFDGTTIRPGAKPVFFFRDPSVPETLHNPFPKLRDGTYVNQKTFFVPRSQINVQALVGGTYTVTLARNDLPLFGPLKSDGTVDLDHLEAPREVWVRVTSVTDEVTTENYPRLKWAVTPRVDPNAERVSIATPFTTDTRGVPSDIVKVTFPTTQTDNFTLALQTALAIAILSRSDIVQPDAVTHGSAPETPEQQAQSSTAIYRPTGLESAIRNLLPTVVPNPQSYFATRGTSPDSFVRDLYTKITHLADQITAAQGNLPQPLLTTLAPKINTLLSWRWSDSTVSGARSNGGLNQTVLESLATGSIDPGTTVLARNVFSLPGYWQNQGSNTPLGLQAQARADLTESTFGRVVNVFGAAPVVYTNGRLWHVRHLIPTEIYTVANEILSLTSAHTASTGGWVAWRPFGATSPLGGNTRVLQTIEGVLRAASAGTEGVENGIANTISFLEQRVKEIQELIARIDDYLDLPFQVAIPDLVALPLVVQGTDGIVSALASAENKPIDGPGAYSGGLVLVGGGIPSILVDLLLLILGATT